MAPNTMPSNFFSLSSLLLATSVFYTLSNAAPIPKVMDVESRDNTLLLPSRDMWSEIVVGDSVLPSGSSSRILPRSPAENPPPSAEARHADFSAPKPSPVARRQVFPRFPLARPLEVGTVISKTGSIREPLIPRMSAMDPIEEMERRTDVFRKATFDPKEPAQKRDNMNAHIGATMVYTGKLFR